MSKGKIVILAGRGETTQIVYNALKHDYEIEKVIIEDKVPNRILIRKRIKRFGIFKVVGQLAFQVLIMRGLGLTSSVRKKEILREFHLDDSPVPSAMVENVKSVNDSRTKALLRDINPRLVIVNGTRIISEEILNSVSASFINTHAGITPKYRNVHGAYWALVNKDPEHCGVTIHLVDKGIDTGKIIYQGKIYPTKQDNFITYPLLQIGAGVPLLKKAINDYFENNLKNMEGPSESRLWYHPTIFQYLYYRLFRSIK